MAAWIVFELSMLEHAFVCYCFEFYLLKAHELDDMETVEAFFTEQAYRYCRDECGSLRSNKSTPVLHPVRHFLCTT